MGGGGGGGGGGAPGQLSSTSPIPRSAPSVLVDELENDDSAEVPEDLNGRFSDVDSGDDEDMALVAQAIDEEDMLGQDSVFESEAQHEALTRMNNSEWSNVGPRAEWRQRNRHNKTLPPISLLFSALEGSQASHAPGRPEKDFRVWSILRKSMNALETNFQAESDRKSLDGQTRIVNSIPMGSDAQVTLNGRRILSHEIVAGFSQILLDDHNAFPYLENEHRPKVWIAPPGAAQHITPLLLVGMFIEVQFHYL